jgi:hypothetical protein
MEPPEEVQSNGKSPISSSSAEVDEETEIGLQQLQGGGDDPLQSPQLPQMETRSRRQRASPSTYNEAVLLGESPPNKSTSKPKTKKGSSTKKGGAKAATLQDRKRRKVVPTEWAPENVFDIIRTCSAPSFFLKLFKTIFMIFLVIYYLLEMPFYINTDTRASLHFLAFKSHP